MQKVELTGSDEEFIRKATLDAERARQTFELACELHKAALCGGLIFSVEESYATADALRALGETRIAVLREAALREASLRSTVAQASANGAAS